MGGQQEMDEHSVKWAAAVIYLGGADTVSESKHQTRRSLLITLFPAIACNDHRTWTKDCIFACDILPRNVYVPVCRQASSSRTRLSCRQ